MNAPAASTFLAKDAGATLDQAVEIMRGNGLLYDEALKEFKARWIKAELLDSHGNKCLAADMLHMHRNTLSRALESLGLKETLKQITRGKKRVYQARAGHARHEAATAATSVRKEVAESNCQSYPAPVSSLDRSSGPAPDKNLPPRSSPRWLEAEQAAMRQRHGGIA